MTRYTPTYCTVNLTQNKIVYWPFGESPHIPSNKTTVKKNTSTSFWSIFNIPYSSMSVLLLSLPKITIFPLSREMTTSLRHTLLYGGSSVSKICSLPLLYNIIKCFENIFAAGANEILSIICVCCRRRCHRRKIFI